MSLHLKRLKIRNSLKDFLINKTDAKDRVFTNHVSSVKPERLQPTIIIKTPIEEYEKISNRQIYLANLEIHIDCLLREQIKIEDELDLLAFQVSNALSENPTLNGMFRELVIPVKTEISIDDSGDRIVGGIRTTWLATCEINNIPEAKDLSQFTALGFKGPLK